MFKHTGACEYQERKCNNLYHRSCQDILTRPCAVNIYLTDAMETSASSTPSFPSFPFTRTCENTNTRATKCKEKLTPRATGARVASGILVANELSVGETESKLRNINARNMQQGRRGMVGWACLLRIVSKMAPIYSLARGRD